MSMIGAAAAICLTVATACGATSGVGPAPSSSPRMLIVFTSWLPDAAVKSGLEPGYRPALTGLTSHDFKTVVPAINSGGTSWVIDVTFTPQGRALFTKLTTDTVAACPGDPATAPAAQCPRRHLAIWVGLTRADIDRWADAAIASELMLPFDLDCISRQPATAACPKLLSNPIITSPITGSGMEIGGNFTQQSATALAAAIT
jgi:preprotein translocase subunit SecD